MENLLTMTTGLECIDGYRHRNKGLYEMWRSKNWAQYVLDLPMIEAPGDRFEYCSGATYLLSAILQKTAVQYLTKMHQVIDMGIAAKGIFA